MKRCPECRRDYYDETLLYCLDDGSPLLEGPASTYSTDEPTTAVLPGAHLSREALTRQLELDRETPGVQPAGGQKASGLRLSRVWIWITGAVVLTGLLAYAVFWWFDRREPKQAPPPQPKLTQVTFADGVEEYPAWSPDGSKVAYSGEIGNVRKIFIKDLATGEENQLTRGGEDDIHAAWSPEGAAIIFVRSQKTNEKLQPADVFGSFDGGDIWSVDIRSGSETKIIDNAFNPAFSPDGKSIAYDASRSGPRRIWTSDSSGHNPQQISTDVSEEAGHVRPRWSADGKRIVFQNIERTKFNIRTVEVEGRKMTWVTNDLNNNLNPVWSQSNRFIYFSSDRGGGINIWRIGVSPTGENTGVPQQVTTGAGQDLELALSPDGKHLSFSVLKQNADIWRLPVSPANAKPTGSPEQVISTTREDSRGAWSPDGSQIAFNSDRTGEMNIWLYSLSDRSTRQLTRGPGGDFQPTWSPDAKSLVFFSSRAGNADIWRVDVESSSLTQLTRDTGTDINPFFSPDGKLIAYQSDRTGRTEIWLMNADGTGDHQLTRTGARGHFTRWNKAGDALVFRAAGAGGAKVMQAPIDGSAPVELPNVNGGGHLSFNPSYTALLDVITHKTLWSSPVGREGVPESVFEFSDPDVRIDYPVWSPDGKWVLFDRFRPEGGDIWMIENFE